MEVVIGPVLALMISLGYTQQRHRRTVKEINTLKVSIEKIVTRTEFIESRLDKTDKDLLKKVMTTVMPLAKAVNKLNNEVGIS